VRDDDTLTRETRRAFRSIDDRIASPPFAALWREAQRRAAPGPETLAARASRWLRPLAAKPAAALALTVMCALLAAWLLRSPAPVAVRPQGELAALPRAPLLERDEAALPWYTPTDALLDVQVLRIERQFVTFASYDPIHMEIRR
jgi:hypothetical protein